MKTENGRQLIQELNSSLSVYFIMSVASLLYGKELLHD